MFDRKILVSTLISVFLFLILGFTGNVFVMGDPSPSPIGDFGTISTLEEAKDMVVNLKIKLPDSSTLPEGYGLQAILVQPMGGVTRETFSDRTFRPEMLHLYYSDNPVNGSMYVFEHPEWIIITESYTLGSNSTRPYTENQVISPDVNVGWFFGYPGYMRDGTILVYQFEEEMAYQIYSTFLSQYDTLTIMKSLLIGNEPIIDTTVTETTTSTVTIMRSTTVTSTETATDFSLYIWAIGSIATTIVLAVILVIRKRSTNQL